MENKEELKGELLNKIKEVEKDIEKLLKEALSEAGFELEGWEITTMGTISDFWLIVYASKNGKTYRYSFGFSIPDPEYIEWVADELGVSVKELEEDTELLDLAWYYIFANEVRDFLDEQAWEIDWEQGGLEI